MAEKQKMRYSDPELALIKAIFAENEDLALAVRRYFLQLDMTAGDLALMKTTFPKGSEALKVLKKSLFPELDGNAPLFQIVDLWMTLNVKDMHPDVANEHIRSRKLFIQFVSEAFSALEGKKAVKPMTLADLVDGGSFAEILAYQTITAHFDLQMRQLITLAGRKDESVEKTVERLRKDSAK